MLTAAGEGLAPVLSVMLAGGDDHRPTGRPPVSVSVERRTGEPVRMADVRADGTALGSDAVQLVRRSG